MGGIVCVVSHVVASIMPHLVQRDGHGFVQGPLAANQSHQAGVRPEG